MVGFTTSVVLWGAIKCIEVYGSKVFICFMGAKTILFTFIIRMHFYSKDYTTVIAEKLERDAVVSLDVHFPDEILPKIVSSLVHV